LSGERFLIFKIILKSEFNRTPSAIAYLKDMLANYSVRYQWIFRSLLFMLADIMHQMLKFDESGNAGELML